MGRLKRIAGLRVAIPRHETFVMIVRAVVVPHGGEVYQSGEVTRDLRERTALKVLKGVPHPHELA